MDYSSLHSETGVKVSLLRQTLTASFYCLISCSAGEVAGKMIVYGFDMNHAYKYFISVTLGFLTGTAWGVIRHLKKGDDLYLAVKDTIRGEWLSIFVMEFIIVFVDTMLENTGQIFSLPIVLASSFIGVIPVNYILIKQGIRHEHI